MTVLLSGAQFLAFLTAFVALPFAIAWAERGTTPIDDPEDTSWTPSAVSSATASGGTTTGRSSVPGDLSTPPVSAGRSLLGTSAGSDAPRTGGSSDEPRRTVEALT